MSTLARLAKGTGLTLGRLGVMILGQLATVPIYLSHWDVQIFGIWLIFQSMLGYLIVVSAAFQQYSYAEMLQRGAADHNGFRAVYQASVAVGYLIAALEFAAVVGLGAWAVSGTIGEAVSGDLAIVSANIFRLLALYSLVQTAMMPLVAITGHAVSVHGRFPRVAFWSLFQGGLVLAAPAVAVLLGGGLMAAGLALIGAHALAVLLSALDMVRLADGHGLFLRQSIDWRMGLRNALFCLPLAGRGFVDSFRHQGFRILLGGFAGPAAVAALGTTRTFANVLHQGLGTITAPLMPELMRYAVARDQARMEGAFAVVWLCLFALLIPGVLLLAAVAEPLFLLWTRGSVAFDPVLFLTLLVVVLVYAAGQPAMAILQGHNRIAWMTSAVAAAVTGLGLLTLVLVPPLGLQGAGFALLGAELCALAVVVLGAARTLGAAGLVFPIRSFALTAGAATAVLGLGLPAVTLWEGSPWAIALPFAANAALGWLYWTTIPALARDRIRAALGALRARLSGAACAKAGTRNDSSPLR